MDSSETTFSDLEPPSLIQDSVESVLESVEATVEKEESAKDDTLDDVEEIHSEKLVRKNPEYRLFRKTCVLFLGVQIMSDL